MPDTPAGEGATTIPAASFDRWTSFTFKASVGFAFFWCIFGLALIYGYRVFWDSPIDPSFVPFMCVGFGVIVSFAIVLTLSYATGDVEFEAPGFKFKGASGPILLWVVCFLAILLGFSMTGITEVVKTSSHQRLAVPDLHRANRIDSTNRTDAGAAKRPG